MFQVFLISLLLFRPAGEQQRPLTQENCPGLFVATKLQNFDEISWLYINTFITC